eukprot:3928268-Amphidinium_carterae.1
MLTVAANRLKQQKTLPSSICSVTFSSLFEQQFSHSEQTSAQAKGTAQPRNCPPKKAGDLSMGRGRRGDTTIGGLRRVNMLTCQGESVGLRSVRVSSSLTSSRRESLGLDPSPNGAWGLCSNKCPRAPAKEALSCGTIKAEHSKETKREREGESSRHARLLWRLFILPFLLSTSVALEGLTNTIVSLFWGICVLPACSARASSSILSSLYGETCGERVLRSQLDMFRDSI